MRLWENTRLSKMDTRQNKAENAYVSPKVQNEPSGEPAIFGRVVIQKESKQYLSGLFNRSPLYGHHGADLLPFRYCNLFFANRAGKRAPRVLLVIVDGGTTVFTGPYQLVFLDPDLYPFVVAARAENGSSRDTRSANITGTELNQHCDHDSQRPEQEANSKGFARIAILNESGNHATDKRRSKNGENE